MNREKVTSNSNGLKKGIEIQTERMTPHERNSSPSIIRESVKSKLKTDHEDSVYDLKQDYLAPIHDTRKISSDNGSFEQIYKKNSAACNSQDH